MFFKLVAKLIVVKGK